ncbi:hypothetical protein CTEN210_13720 [Chaetoceros tenuissimus]|uniref:RRM domain-containing protein n=1 Tax=Chaetoceros tenuissimus TaxID=426638 RepID=A0AAD3HBN6_9STRA|nr:hypothetical protein CTEN210_13720 [Chaetoceros tenuissimus]
MESNNDFKQRIGKAMSLLQEVGEQAAVLQSQNPMEPEFETEKVFVNQLVKEINVGATYFKRKLRILKSMVVDHESDDAQICVQSSNLKRRVEDENELKLKHSDTSKGNKRVNLSNATVMEEAQYLSESTMVDHESDDVPIQESSNLKEEVEQSNTSEGNNKRMNLSNATIMEEDQHLSKSTESETKNRPKDESEVRRSVYVTNVPYEATKAELEQEFMKYGLSKVLSLQKNGDIITTANVMFETEEATKRCLQQKEIDFQSRKMRLKPYRSEKASGSKTIYCGDFPFNVKVDEQKVREAFKECGPIQDVKMIPSQSCCHVCFEEDAGADEAVKINGEPLFDSDIMVRVDYTGK